MINGDENLSSHLLVTIQRSWAVARSLGFGSPKEGSEAALRQWLRREGVISVEALQIRLEQGRACIEVSSLGPGSREMCKSLLSVVAQLRHTQVYVQHNPSSMSSLGHPTTARNRLEESLALAR